MKAAALTTAILLILPLLAAAVSPVVRADDVQPAVVAAPGDRTETQPAAAPLKTHLSGPQPFITLLCKFADVDDEPVPPSYFEELLGATRPGLDDYWREVSYGQISLQGSRVAGWYRLPHPAATYRSEEMSQTGLDRLADDCVAAADADVHFPDFAGINLVFNRALDDAAWGGGKCLELDGESRCYGAAWLWPNAFARHNIVVHEIGHTFGLDHSSAGRGEIYGNLWDAMGVSSVCEPDPVYGSLAPHMIAYDKDQLGWIPAGRKIVVSSRDTVTVELAALANPAAQGYLLAQAPAAGATGRFYTVEARQRIGYDSTLPADAVIIHEVDPTREPAARLVNHLGDGDTRGAAGMWQPGDVFIDATGGVAVAVDHATATGFVVTIATGPRPWPLAPAGSMTLPAGDTSFAWQPVPQATGYQLRIEPEEVLASAGPLTRAVTAAGATISLPPGAYRWQVRALPAGEWTPPVRVVAGFAGRRWLPSEVVSDAGGKARSGLAIAVDPRHGVSIAWAATEGMFLPVYVRVARRGAAGWQVAEQIIPDYDLQIGPLPILAIGAGGEACGIWIDQMPTVDRMAALTGSMTNGGLWLDCWAPTQGPGAMDATGERKRARPESAVRMNDGDTHVRPSRPVLVLDRAGNAVAAWNGARGGDPALFSARRPAGRPSEPAEKITRGVDPWGLWSPALAVDEAGDLHAIWADSHNQTTGLYAATRTADGWWGPSIRVSDPGAGSRINPAIAVDGQGNTYAVWQHFQGCAGGDATGDIEFAQQPAGAGWEQPIRVSTDIGSTNVSMPVIAAGREGAAYLVWEEMIDSRFTLYSSFRPASGEWEPKTPIPDAAGNRAPAGPALAIDAEGNAYVTWLDTRGAQPVIRLATAAR